MKGRWVVVLALLAFASVTARADLHQHSLLDTSNLHLEMYLSANAPDTPPQEGDWVYVGGGDMQMIGGMNINYWNEPGPYSGVNVPSINATNATSWGSWLSVYIGPPLEYVFAWLEFDPGQIQARVCTIPDGTVDGGGNFSIPGDTIYYEVTSFNYDIYYGLYGTMPVGPPPDATGAPGPPPYPPPDPVPGGYPYPYIETAPGEYIHLLWFGPNDPAGEYIFGTEGPINSGNLPSSFTGSYTEVGSELASEISHSELRYENFVWIDENAGMGLWLSLRFTGDYQGMTPEPSSMLLLVGGLGALVAVKRRKK
ncbi:MAG TPA: PEP-CTERM sorting domain-containing protein [Candidatus Brocadiia bacterium]|nr:PEP-CTERM sorting domain-containing protein [Candidatus Brocadiia bacterium]